MHLAKKSGIKALALSSFVMILFCYTPSNTPVVASSISSISSPAKLVGNLATNDSSLNWAGYAINAPVNSVTHVKGSWKEPSVTCPVSTMPEAAVFWVGIDGFTSSTVEQTGTMAECLNGVVSYSAWYEFYPNFSVFISTLTIHPGDIISASVKYSTTSKFTTTIQDVTTTKSFSHTASVPAAMGSSAEWITEAPEFSVNGVPTLSKLPNFGKVYFGRDTTLVLGTDTATISGVTNPIAKFGSSVVEITMVNLLGTKTMAKSSSLSIDGTSFSVKWISAGP
jgi:Peptidase A4 family